MPFTPSHAVVALPFVRTPLMPAAIAVGAMTPDLPLFVRALPLSYGATHDLALVPATGLVALALLLVWRALLRPAARELAPRWLAARLPAAWDAGAMTGVRETVTVRGRAGPSWVGALVLALSLAVGIVSHIVWDLFTHEGRWGVTAMPVLEQAWGPFAGYKWLQYGSSFLGLAILAVWALGRVHRADASEVAPRFLPSPLRWVWWVSLPLVLGIACAGGLAALGPLTDEFTAAHLAYRVLPPACAIWGALTVVTCLAVQLMRRSADQSVDLRQTGSSHPHGRGAGKDPGPPS